MRCARDFSQDSLYSQHVYLRVNYPQNSPQYQRLKRKAQGAIRNKRVFFVYGKAEEVVLQGLSNRGWVEKIPRGQMTFNSIINTVKDADEKRKQVERMLLSKLVDKVKPNLVWNADTYRFNYCIGTTDDAQITYNRLKTGALWTSKDGLCNSLRNLHWNHIEGVAEINIPRTYTNFNDEETDAFITDYRLTACTSLLKWSLIMVNNNESIAGITGEIELTVYVFALNRCKEFLNNKQNKDIDAASAPIVNDSQWNLFLQQINLLIDNQALFKSDTEKKLPLYLCYAKLLIIEMVKYRPQLTCDGFNNVWIVKPVNFCRGVGIELASDFMELSDIQNKRSIKKVLQKYIEEPLLIHETKFDIRQYYLVTSTYPMVIWMYNDCYIKLSTQKYNIKDYHESIHLTNYAVQSKYEVSANRSKELPNYNMWSMDTFKKYLVEIGKPDVWSKVIYPGMRKSIVSVMLTCQESIDHAKNRFELYGCDFLFDNTYKPWLIEINCCPDLYPSTEITAKLCPQVVADLLKVVFDYSANPKTSTGKFCCIYRQSTFLPPYVYSKANHFLVRGLALPMKYFYRHTEQINEDIYDDVEDNLSSNNETVYTLKTVYESDFNLIMTDQKLAEMDQEMSERVVLLSKSDENLETVASIITAGVHDDIMEQTMPPESGSPKSDDNLETVASIITGVPDDIMDRIMPPESCLNENYITTLTNTHVSQNHENTSLLPDNLQNHKQSANGLTVNNISELTTTAVPKITETTSFEELKIKETRSLDSFRSTANLKRTSTEIIPQIENIVEKITSHNNNYYNNCVTQSTSASFIKINRSTSAFKFSSVETGMNMENLVKRMLFGSINENNITEFMATTSQTHKSISPLESSPVRTLPSIINRIILNTIENLKIVATQIQDRFERIISESYETKNVFQMSTTTIPKHSETSPLELISDEIHSTANTKKKLKFNENHAQITHQTNCLLDIFPCEYDKSKDEVINSMTTSSLPVHEDKINVNKFKADAPTMRCAAKSMNLLECNSEKTTLRNLKSCLIEKFTPKKDLLNNKLPTITTLETPKSTSLFEFSLKRTSFPGTLQQTSGSYEDSNTSSPSIKGQEDKGIKKHISKNDLTSIASSNKATGLEFTLNKTNLLQLLRKLLTLEEDFQEAATVLEKQMDNNSVVKEESKKDVTLVTVPILLRMTMSQTHKETSTSDFTPSESSVLKVTKEILELDGELKEEAIVLANQKDESKYQMNCNYDTSQNHITNLSKSVISVLLKHEENNNMEIAPLKIYEAEITRRILKSKEKLGAVVSALKNRMSILVAKNSFMNNHSGNMVTKLKRTMSETHKITKYDIHSPQGICPVKLVVEYLKTENVCDNIATKLKENRATKLTRLCNNNKHKGTSCLEYTLPEKPQAIQDFLKISQELDDITTAIIRELYDIMYQVAIRNRSTKNCAKKITEASLLQSSLRQLPIECTQQSSKSDDLFAPDELLAQLDEFLYHVNSSTPTVCRSDFNYYNRKSSFSSFNKVKQTNV